MPAKMQGDLVAYVHRFRLGAFEVATVLDGVDLRYSVKPPFCLDMED